eukprot:SM000097S24787  [mRNA]  locus=s97:200835:202181:- [translate_table: standard]
MGRRDECAEMSACLWASLSCAPAPLMPWAGPLARRSASSFRLATVGQLNWASRRRPLAGRLRPGHERLGPDGGAAGAGRGQGPAAVAWAAAGWSWRRRASLASSRAPAPGCDGGLAAFQHISQQRSCVSMVVRDSGDSASPPASVSVSGRGRTSPPRQQQRHAHFADSVVAGPMAHSSAPTLHPAAPGMMAPPPDAEDVRNFWATAVECLASFEVYGVAVDWHPAWMPPAAVAAIGGGAPPRAHVLGFRLRHRRIAGVPLRLWHELRTVVAFPRRAPGAGGCGSSVSTVMAAATKWPPAAERVPRVLSAGPAWRFGPPGSSGTIHLACARRSAAPGTQWALALTLGTTLRGLRLEAGIAAPLLVAGNDVRCGSPTPSFAFSFQALDLSADKTLRITPSD